MANTKTTTLVSIRTARNYLQARAVVKGVNTDPSDDDRLAVVADACSDRFEQMTGRYGVQRGGIVETFVGDDRAVRFLPKSPLVSIQSVACQSQSGSTVVDPSQYFADVEAGAVRLWCGRFVRGALYQVTYTAGYDAAQDGAGLPSGVVQVVLDMIKFTIDRANADGLASSSIKTGEASLNVVPKLPKDLVDAIQLYADTRY